MTSARESSDYFNALPLEQRKMLAPLLEDYRRLGMQEYADAMRSAQRKMDDRMRALKERTP